MVRNKNGPYLAESYLFSFFAHYNLFYAFSKHYWLKLWRILGVIIHLNLQRGRFVKRKEIFWSWLPITRFLVCSDLFLFIFSYLSNIILTPIPPYSSTCDFPAIFARLWQFVSLFLPAACGMVIRWVTKGVVVLGPLAFLKPPLPLI